jgi:hypothetical protein
LQPGEERSAVEDRNPGRQHTLLGGHQDPVLIGGVGVDWRNLNAHGIIVGDAAHANAFDQPAAVRLELDDEALQERHGVDLRLVAQPDTTGERERNVGFRCPVRGQTGLAAGVQFGAGVGDAGCGLRIAERVFPLSVEPVLLAVPEQPVAALQVAGHVPLDHVLAVPGGDAGELRALEQADLAGRVAGGPRAHVTGLDHHDALARTGQQHGGRHAGDACTHHDDVGGHLAVVERRRGRYFDAVGEPE